VCFLGGRNQIFKHCLDKLHALKDSLIPTKDVKRQSEQQICIAMNPSKKSGGTGNKPGGSEDKSSGGGKDDSGSAGGDTESVGSGKKPGSAGASSREAALRILQLSQKGEWPPVDQALKALEKIVAAGGEDTNTTPLLGVMDPVS